MMSIILYTLWAILAIIIIIGCWIVINLAHAQEETTTTKAPPPVVPTPTTQPTPTKEFPNLQYLPQKAYVQAYAPENGIPTGQPPLQVVPQVVPVQPQQQPSIQNNLIDSVGGIAGVMGVLTAAGAYVKTHFIDKKTKETMAAEVKTKEQVHELARVTYENMPQKGNEITDAPAIKLETLKEDKQEFTDKAAKA